MFRRSPRALVLLGLSATLAIVTGTVVASDLSQLHRRARDLGPPRTVAVAARDLTVGTTISTSDIDVRRLHRSQLPPGALARDAVLGRVVTVPVLDAGVVTARHLGSRQRDGQSGAVPAGMRVVRIVVEEVGLADAGTYLDVLATFDGTPATTTPGPEPSPEADPGTADEADTEEPPVLPTVAVARGALVIASDDATGDAGAGTGITLLVTTREATALAFARANAVITVAVVPPEDARPVPPT